METGTLKLKCNNQETITAEFPNLQLLQAKLFWKKSLQSLIKIYQKVQTLVIKANIINTYPLEKKINIIKATTKIRIFKPKMKETTINRGILKEQRYKKQEWKDAKLSTQHKDHVVE